MGEAAFNVPIQKVCRYLQVITSEMRQDICGHADWQSHFAHKSTTSTLKCIDAAKGNWKIRNYSTSRNKERRELYQHYTVQQIFISLWSTLTFIPPEIHILPNPLPSESALLFFLVDALSLISAGTSYSPFFFILKAKWSICF